MIALSFNLEREPTRQSSDREETASEARQEGSIHVHDG
jgi:hypothetical protein